MRPGTPDRSPLLWILLPFCIGSFIAAHATTPSILLSAGLGALFSILAILYYKRSLSFWIVSIALASLSLGNLRYAVQNPGPLDRLEFPEREAQLEVQVERVFRSKSAYLNGFAKIRAADTHLEDFVGKRIYFSVYASEQISELLPSTILLLKGIAAKFKATPSAFDDFLSANKIQITLKRGHVVEIRKQPTLWRRMAKTLNNNLLTIISRGIRDLPEQLQTYAAMTLGLRGQLTPAQKDVFLKSGAMHLFAISGLHVGVIAACGHSFFLLLRMPQKWILFLNTGFVLIFVLATGGAASAWRAFAMIAAYYFSLFSKRQSSLLNALVLSAILCLLIDPRQLFQAGFQMSYATVGAIVMYGIPLSDFMQSKWKPFAMLPRSLWKIPHHIVSRSGKYLIGSACICISAFTTSSLLSIIYFNLFSTIGAVVNLAYLPLAALVISAGFCSILCGILFLAPLSILFNHSAALLLTVLDWLSTVAATSEISYVSYENSHQPGLFAALIGLLVIMAILYARNWTPRKATLLIPPLYSISIAVLFAWF